MAEHWLRDELLESVVVSNYSLVSHYCRTVRASGGVCIFARNNTKFEMFKFSDLINVEIDIEICGVINKEQKLLVLVLYRSPAGWGF